MVGLHWPLDWVQNCPGNTPECVWERVSNKVETQWEVPISDVGSGIPWAGVPDWFWQKSQAAPAFTFLLTLDTKASCLTFLPPPRPPSQDGFYHLKLWAKTKPSFLRLLLFRIFVTASKRGHQHSGLLCRDNPWSFALPGPTDEHPPIMTSLQSKHGVLGRGLERDVQ